MTDQVTDVLARVTDGLPGGGEPREGQAEMARMVGHAIASRQHLVVQAGTGTGKSLAYLVPAALAGEKVVVATATKALQDQLADKDLPLVAKQTGNQLTYAVLKGRSNYLCKQRASEVGGGPGQQLALGDGEGVGHFGDQVRRLLQWADESPTGDRAELDFEPHGRAWAMVSTTARECPGAFRCPSGQDCFAEAARARAAEADVVVVNTHLYGAHVASGGAVLPAHDVVVFDEAHEVEEVMTDSLGTEIGPGRFRALAVAARTVVLTRDNDVVDAVAECADALHQALGPWAGARIPGTVFTADPAGDARLTALDDGENGSGAGPGNNDGNGTPALLERAFAGATLVDGPAPTRAPTGTRVDPARPPSGSGQALGDVTRLAAGRTARLVDALRRAEREAGEHEPGPDRARRDRALLAAGHLADDLAKLPVLTDDEVAWVDGGPKAPALRISPIEVGPLLAERLWDDVTGVLTSATVPVGLPGRLGLPADNTSELDVGSPFDYRAHSQLYVARSLPDRRKPESEPAIHDELAELMTAAGGRTLALFTSWRAMSAAVEALRPRVPFRILAQSDLPKPALIEAFRSDEATCLFATLGFWQGVDVPGRTLSLVAIDRIPFPRPDDPVLQARRDRAGDAAFREVDLPRAGTLLAQGAGRLIRSAGDRGVVAVLDSRLATARYRSVLLARVPPMRRVTDRQQVTAFLREQREPQPG